MFYIFALWIYLFAPSYPTIKCCMNSNACAVLYSWISHNLNYDKTAVKPSLLTLTFQALGDSKGG